MKLAIFLLGAFALSAQPLTKINETGYAKMIASNKGKVLLVDFWATWCVPCRKEMPELVKLEAKLKAKGLTLVTISADDLDNEPAAREFLAKTGVKSIGYLKAPKDDDAFVKGVDAKWSGELPALLLYNKTGNKVKMWKGETPMAELEAAIAKLL